MVLSVVRVGWVIYRCVQVCRSSSYCYDIEPGAVQCCSGETPLPQPPLPTVLLMDEELCRLDGCVSVGNEVPFPVA